MIYSESATLGLLQFSSEKITRFIQMVSKILLGFQRPEWNSPAQDIAVDRSRAG